MRIVLTVTAGPHESRKFFLEGHDVFLVGRARQAHFHLAKKDLRISRVHFMIEANLPLCRLRDMDSRNGTFVNGQKVKTADLRDGDEIRVGRTILQVAIESALPTLPEPGPAKSEPLPVAKLVDDFVPTLWGPSPAKSEAAVTPTPASAPIPPPVVAPPVETGIFNLPTLAPVPIPTPVVAPIAAPKITVIPPSAPIPIPTPPPKGSKGPADSPKPILQAPLCLSCNARLPDDGTLNPFRDSPGGEPRLCPACMRESQRLPQSIPGYLIVRKLGSGAMGVVHLAVRAKDGAAVAVKTIAPAAGTAEDIQRFLKEAKILRALDHPHIVAYRDMGEANGTLYLAMDYVRGTDAGNLLKSNKGPLSTPRAVGLVCQMLEALEYAHGKRCVHRDIKPANVLVATIDGREVVKIADFGLAKFYQESSISGLSFGNLTVDGQIGGTPWFMPPEQITDFRGVKPAADQYSTAAMLYQLLTGRFIFDPPETIDMLFVKIVCDDPVAIRERRPEVPDGLAAAIHRALAKKPEARFASAAEMRLALSRFLR